MIIVVLVFTFIDIKTRWVKKDNNIENYRNYNLSRTLMKTYLDEELVIFPQTITQEMTINDYSTVAVFNQSKLIGWQIYLNVTYVEQAYQAEIERLSTWKRVLNKSSSKQIEVKFKYDNGEYFDFPAYIASYNCAGLDEYAILYGENSIAYVFLTRILENETTLPKQFVAKGYYDLAARFENGDLKAGLVNPFSVYLGN